jgi:hypothetical protein
METPIAELTKTRAERRRREPTPEERQPDNFDKIIKALRRQAKADNKQPVKVHRVIEVTRATPVADDAHHALKAGAPEFGSFLLSLPEYTGKDVVDCVFNIPNVGIVIVPGLNSPVFRAQSVPAYTQSVRSAGCELVRLPNIYVILNQCMTALHNEKMDEENYRRYGQVSDRQPYNWARAAREIRREAQGLAARILDVHALRIRQGAGFMALAQANGNLTVYEVGVGLELANQILRNLQSAEREERRDEILAAKAAGRKIDYVYNTVSDIAGVLLTVVCRFPATTSESVRLNMHIVLSGRGMCIYLNPDVLKTGMEGDVDGDLIFAETDAQRRKAKEFRMIVLLPNVVTRENFLCDFGLGDCFGCDEDDTPLFEYDDYKVYEGMDGKNGIGEATNLFYRGVNIIHIQFMGSKETRKEFWDFVNRPDLKARMPKTRSEPELQRWFRYLSALALIDAIHPIYEGLFDLRKDQAIRDYLLHFLAAVRGQEQLNFEYMAQMEIKGEPIDLRAIELMWNAAQVGDAIGKPTAFVRQYPIVDLFFRGRGATEGKRQSIGKILDHLQSIGVEDPAEYIFEELNCEHFTLMDFDQNTDMDLELE